MNRKELVEAMQAYSKNLAAFSKKDMDEALDAFLETVKKSIKKGEEVALVGFGTFSKQKRKARMGQNPMTGEKIKIKARNVVKFKAGKAFKDSL